MPGNTDKKCPAAGGTAGAGEIEEHGHFDAPSGDSQSGCRSTFELFRDFAISAMDAGEPKKAAMAAKSAATERQHDASNCDPARSDARRGSGLVLLRDAIVRECRKWCPKS